MISQSIWPLCWYFSSVFHSVSCIHLQRNQCSPGEIYSRKSGFSDPLSWLRKTGFLVHMTIEKSACWRKPYSQLSVTSVCKCTYWVMSSIHKTIQRIMTLYATHKEKYLLHLILFSVQALRYTGLISRHFFFSRDQILNTSNWSTLVNSISGCSR